MKTLHATGLAAVLVLLGCGTKVVRAQDALPTVEEVERKALEYRKGIDTGHVVFTAVNHDNSNESQRMRYTVTFDHDLIRYSWVGGVEGTDGWGPPHMTTIAEDEHYCNYPPPVAVTIDFNSRVPKVREQYQVLDPRALGMDVNSIASIPTKGLKNLVDRAGRSKPEMSKADFEGQATWLIKYVTFEGLYVQMWIAPDQGYGLVHAETRIDSPNGLNGLLVFTVTSTLKRYPDGDIWYPARVENQSAIAGKLNQKQIVEVEQAKFNMKVDPETFTLAGLGLEAGRPISDRRGNGHAQVWDGKQAVEVELPDAP